MTVKKSEDVKKGGITFEIDSGIRIKNQVVSKVEIL